MDIVFLQAAPQGGGGMMQIVLLVGMFLVFYLFMIRPQQKKAKEDKKFNQDLKKGDKVVTAGGIHGRIIGTEGDTVSIEVDKGMKIKVEKSYDLTIATNIYRDCTDFSDI